LGAAGTSSSSSGNGSIGNGREGEMLGTGRVWWNEVGAAESSGAEAAALREAWGGSARRRLLLPHCWQLVLAQDGGGAGGQQEQGVLAELASCYGTQLGQVRQHLEQQLAAAAQLPAWKLAQLLPLALLAMGQQVQQALAGVAAAAEQAGLLGRAAAELTGAVEARLVQQLQRAGTPSGLLADNAWTAALPVVLEDALLVQQLALRVQQHGKAARRKKGKKAPPCAPAEAGSGAAAGEGAAVAVAQAVAAAGAAMQALASAVQRAAAKVLRDAPKPEHGAQQLLQQAGELEAAPGVQAGAALWGWERQLEAAAEVQQLLGEQHATLRRLQELARRRSDAIAAALVGLA
jgi:hypothetical protein